MPKKRKVEEEPPSSWRIKCIESFNLKPVPEAWKDGVAVGTESAWKTYFEYRTSEEEASSKQARGGEDYHGDEGESYIMKMWKEKMNWTKSSDEWLSWTPKVWDLSFEDEDELRTAEYIGHIWSPYVIPHALRLRHFYHCRARYSSVEFSTSWNYEMMDFERAISKKRSEGTELCSNCYEDEELRADVISTSNLNIETVNDLRRFLFGSDSEDSKKLICPDDRFLRILFGAMGTVDRDMESDMLNGNLGYIWKVGYQNDEKLRRFLFEAQVPEDDDPEGDPPESYDEYYPRGCSWLRHRILEITGMLGPVSRHYKHPTIKDAPGYNEYSDEDREYSDEEEDDARYLPL